MPPYADFDPWEQPMSPPEPEHRHLQKGIPVALITGLLFPLAVIVWGAAILFNNVDDHARRIAKLEATDDDVRRDASRISEQLARIDERLAAQTDLMRRLHERLMAGGRRQCVVAIVVARGC
jgi:hypothetical protein